MKAIILAGGPDKELRDRFKMPKPLLEVKDKPIVEHIVEKISRLKNIDGIILVTNTRDFSAFNHWLNSYKSNKKIKIVNDGTFGTDYSLGSVGALYYVLQKEDITDDVVVLGGSNLFSFDISKMIRQFNKRKRSMVAFKDLKDPLLLRGKFGMAELDSSNKIIHFEEKPVNPTSSLASTACYVLFNKDLSTHLPSFINKKESWKRMGDFILFLMQKSEVYGFTFDDYWMAIKDENCLKDANKNFK